MTVMKISVMFFLDTQEDPIYQLYTVQSRYTRDVKIERVMGFKGVSGSLFNGMTYWDG